jgi:alpha-D-ribose 1-methylphosphonate 5-triphosphate diphosphatase
VEHDHIKNITAYGESENVQDFGSYLIVPGFVDLHSDAVEKEIEPRPGAAFPLKIALIEMDKKLAMSGVTTMFHAIAFNEESLVGLRRNKTAKKIVELVHAYNQEHLLVDNRLHARYEITSFSSVPVLEAFLDREMIHILSFMDHTTGQGQFQSIEDWKQYHMPVYELSDAQADTVIENQRRKKAEGMHFIHRLAVKAKEKNVQLASHDDDSIEKIDFMAKLGVSVSEFPLNVTTAAYARKRNLHTGMGAPNVVRGKSQSGNLSAREVIGKGTCRFLCSDYHPSSMLQAVYSLHREMHYSLADAFAFVTSTPAEITGLDDRGRIAPGRLADLVVIDDQFVPKVVWTCKSGQPVYTNLPCACSYATL